MSQSTGAPAVACATNSHQSEDFMIRKLIVFFCLMLAVTAWGFAAEPAPVKIMTQNMDAGTDLTFAVAELLGLLPPGVDGVGLTYWEIQLAEIPGRAGLLAAKVAEKKPDLLACRRSLCGVPARRSTPRPRSCLTNSNCCAPPLQIGRASCRERESISVVAA